ncbi:unnamed protein product [Cyclocybe aegerita]|uniref:Uncharacterized protein n=1 Tax=Cyclocybe aegerita TaxID=1973307 RepID=A0A8S0XTA4_CYCAE|nr:unnamed protein product [Cyclocybe aegerita]
MGRSERHRHFTSGRGIAVLHCKNEDGNRTDGLNGTWKRVCPEMSSRCSSSRLSAHPLEEVPVGVGVERRGAGGKGRQVGRKRWGRQLGAGAIGVSGNSHDFKLELARVILHEPALETLLTVAHANIGALILLGVSRFRGGRVNGIPFLAPNIHLVSAPHLPRSESSFLHFTLQTSLFNAAEHDDRKRDDEARDTETRKTTKLRVEDTRSWRGLNGGRLQARVRELHAPKISRVNVLSVPPDDRTHLISSLNEPVG